MPSKKLIRKKARRAARRAAEAASREASKGGQAPAAPPAHQNNNADRPRRSTTNPRPELHHAPRVSRANAWSQHSPNNHEDSDSDYEPSIPTSDSDYEPSVGLPVRETTGPRSAPPPINYIPNPRIPSSRFLTPIYANQVLATRPTDLRLRDLSPEEQIRQNRYCFISHPDAIAFCRSCHERNHKMSECPLKLCTHCNAWDKHLSWQCPDFRRCRRCRTRGHHEDGCFASYMHPPSTAHPCDRCNSPAHIERQCPTRWRRPIPKDFVRVPNSRIKRNCYKCGSHGHFGDDCPRLPPEIRAERIASGSPWNETYVSQLVYYDDHPAQAQVRAFTQVNGATALQTGSDSSHGGTADSNGYNAVNVITTREYNYQASLLADWDD